MAENIDPDQPSGIPCMLLMEVNGMILWQQNSIVNGDELRAKVLARLGMVYQP
jgi:hypothetical protein